MSNVSRHMQSCRANGSAKKRRVVLRECAAWRSAVGSRKAELAQALCRAVRPAAAGAPIVEAPSEQRPASCRAVRPSAASAPVRVREQEVVASAKRSKNFSAQSNVRSSPRPCEYAAPALLRSSATAGIGHAAHAGGSVGSIRRMQVPQAFRSRNHRAVCEQNTVTANPSIERTNNGGRQLAVLRASRAVVCRSCRTLALSEYAPRNARASNHQLSPLAVGFHRLGAAAPGSTALARVTVTRVVCARTAQVAVFRRSSALLRCAGRCGVASAKPASVYRQVVAVLQSRV
jgi:hypothetical protein